MDKDTDKDTDKNTDMDKEKDKDKDTDMELNLKLELEYLSKIYLRRFSPYSAIWITYNTSRRKFQRHYKLVAPLPDKNYEMLSFKFS
jgi:frataxin-like iron-binding protein CyaY